VVRAVRYRKQNLKAEINIFVVSEYALHFCHHTVSIKKNPTKNKLWISEEDLFSPAALFNIFE
jgi:hypothetical protein